MPTLSRRWTSRRAMLNGTCPRFLKWVPSVRAVSRGSATGWCWFTRSATNTNNSSSTCFWPRTTSLRSRWWSKMDQRVSNVCPCVLINRYMAIEEQVLSSHKILIKIYKSATCRLEEKFHCLTSEPKGQIEPRVCIVKPFILVYMCLNRQWKSCHLIFKQKDHL